MKTKTIAAICTPIGAGGIAIIRISGEDAANIAAKFFYTKNQIYVTDFEPRKLYLGKLVTKNFTEQAMCVFFKAPYSFTGENIVEFQIHGGVKIAAGVLETCLENGATLANNGEFSKRAFLNGKLSLDEAEGIINMINASTDAGVRAGYSLLSGELKNQIENMQGQLTTLIAKVNVALDYPEHDIEYETAQTVKNSLENIENNINNILNTYNLGKNITDGVNCALIGKPNVGKSSIMNALLSFDRAIVTNIAGTTRDTLKESFVYRDIKINLIDTAGIRETLDEVEKIGVNRSQNALNEADIILFVVDNNQKPDKDELELLEKIKDKKFILIKNKCDLPAKNELLAENQLDISTITKHNIEKLKEMIYNICVSSVEVNSSIILTNLRHKQVLEEAVYKINNAINSAKANQTLDIIAMDLMSAYSTLGEITGQTTGEEILNEIFSKFCLGK